MIDRKSKDRVGATEKSVQSDDTSHESNLSVMQVLASNVESLLTVTMDECAKSVKKAPDNPMSSTIEQLFKQLGPALSNELKSWQDKHEVSPTRPASKDVQANEQHGQD